MKNPKDFIIAIGASTGGTDAIASIIKQLPQGSPGIVIVQHMPPGFTSMYAQRLLIESKLEVKEARDGDRVKEGRVIVAAGGYHLSVFKDSLGYYVTSRQGEKVNGHIPSVDVLFHSVAKSAGKNAVGILLTGMGADGAQGLLSMRKAGAYTIGQNKESCVVYGMPKAAYEAGAVCKQLPLSAIAEEIISETNNNRT